jgi:large subunit ribosomal protein L28
MAKCEVCGKSVQFGHNVSHSNKKTRKIWKPNVKLLRVLENGRVLRKYVCTRCIRTGSVKKAV